MQSEYKIESIQKDVELEVEDKKGYLTPIKGLGDTGFNIVFDFMSQCHLKKGDVIGVLKAVDIKKKKIILKKKFSKKSL